MSQREYAYQKIRDAITYGELKPGERLVEKDICAMFKVGRTPLREALRQLQMEGYVSFLHNKGVTISRISIQDVEQIYNILAILEGYATKTAVKHLSTADREELTSIQKELIRAWTAKNYRKWLDKNRAFHLYFAKASANNHLITIIINLRNRVYRYGFLASTIPGHVEEYFKAHEEILDTLSKKESDRAGKTMQRHISHVAKVLIQFLRQSPGL